MTATALSPPLVAGSLSDGFRPARRPLWLGALLSSLLVGVMAAAPAAGSFAGLTRVAAQDELQVDQAAVDQPAVDEPAAPGRNAAAIPQPVEIYKGRRVAQTMHFLGAEWLIRNTREREERCSVMLATLGVKRGMTICDMGCGNGFYTLPMAKMVGAEGHVYGVDIQPEMLKMLNDRGDREGVRNFTPILGAFHDPRLPKAKIDLILCVDVYHEFSYPEPMLRGMRESLAPGGTVVLVEYRGEDPQVPIKPEHKMTKPQIMKELNANGFKLVKQFDKLPWQHMMWFGREDDATLEAVEPTLWNPASGAGRP
jgi:2-polyprenyl-3-methyl-5-hydroxy-6-metoxy-1,4-benzoquinol methylase